MQAAQSDQRGLPPYMHTAASSAKVQFSLLFFVCGVSSESLYVEAHLSLGKCSGFTILNQINTDFFGLFCFKDRHFPQGVNMQCEITVEVIDKPILACTTLYSFGSGIQLKITHDHDPGFCFVSREPCIMCRIA